MLDFMLRAKAATKLRTSVIALTENEYNAYRVNVINHFYPKLPVHNPTLYAFLTFSTDAGSSLTEPYEWWMATVLGPEACSRDIADLIDSLDYWYSSHREYATRNGVKLCKGDEWTDELENAIFRYQQFYPLFLEPTGYADAETVRRLRLNE